VAVFVTYFIRKTIPTLAPRSIPIAGCVNITEVLQEEPEEQKGKNGSGLCTWADFQIGKLHSSLNGPGSDAAEESMD
jgi:hypothetical protein